MEYELVYGLPKAEVLAQMAEELTEAAQAALKLRRAMDGANPTPISVDTGKGVRGKSDPQDNN